MSKKKLMLNLGCGVRVIKDFINIDNSFTLKDLQQKKGVFKNAVIEKGGKFVQADMKKLPYKNDSVDYIECSEAIEHIPLREVILVFNEIHRVLKPGCKAIVLTTDFADIARMWLDELNKEDFSIERFFEICTYIYGNQLTNGEYHRSAFSPWYIKRLSDTVGFKDLKVILYPKNSIPPEMKTMVWGKNAVFSGAMLYCELTK